MTGTKDTVDLLPHVPKEGHLAHLMRSCTLRILAKGPASFRNFLFHYLPKPKVTAT